MAASSAGAGALSGRERSVHVEGHLSVDADGGYAEFAQLHRGRDRVADEGVPQGIWGWRRLTPQSVPSYDVVNKPWGWSCPASVKLAVKSQTDAGYDYSHEFKDGFHRLSTRWGFPEVRNQRNHRVVRSCTH